VPLFSCYVREPLWLRLSFKTEYRQGIWTYGGGDQIVTFAKNNSQKVRAYGLVWASNVPDWLPLLNSTSPDLAVKSHIGRLMQHWAGKITTRGKSCIRAKYANLSRSFLP
jgi:hypothetical protein